MADKLRKFRKDDYVEKRFGKDINISTKEDAPLKKDMSAAETKSVEKAKPSSGAAKPTSFAAAFRAARDAGQKTFEWAGKPGVTFTTQYASEKKAAPTPVRRAAPAARASTSAVAPKQVSKPGIPAAAKAVADKAAGYRAAFQRQDGQAGFSKPKVAATTPAPTPKPAAKAVADKAAGYRAAFQRQDGQAGFSKGGSVRSVDGIAKRGKTRAPMKRK